MFRRLDAKASFSVVSVTRHADKLINRHFVVYTQKLVIDISPGEPGIIRSKIDQDICAGPGAAFFESFEELQL